MRTYPYRLQKPFQLLLITLGMIGAGIFLGYKALYDPRPLSIRFFRLITMDLTEIQMAWFVGVLSALGFAGVAALLMLPIMISLRKPTVLLQEQSIICPKGFAGMKKVEVAYDDIYEYAFSQTSHALCLEILFTTGKLTLSSQHFSEKTLAKIAQHISDYKS